MLLLIELFDGNGLLFLLHSPILKPNLELSLSQLKTMGHFDPSTPCDVVICVILLLQLQGLVTGVSLTACPPYSVGPRK